MTASPQELARIVVIGVGATVVMDAWLLVLARINLASLDFAPVGRWVATWRAAPGGTIRSPGRRR
jgi:hypothetical protein